MNEATKAEVRDIHLGILERTNPAVDSARPWRLYHDYKMTSERPFAGKSRGKEELHAAALHSEPFLAQYGYAEMAELLCRTRCLIHSAVTSKGAAKDFAGHAGGHTFVMALSADRVAPVCDAVVLGFDAEVTRHPSPEDREA